MIKKITKTKSQILKFINTIDNYLFVIGDKLL
jgi:hypothetical protein